MRGVYQALAVASMCIQEEAASRPAIADVVTALSYLASQAYDPGTCPTSNSRPGGERRNRSADEGGGRMPALNSNAETTHNWQLNGENTSKETSANVRQGSDRERALAEAKIWGGRTTAVNSNAETAHNWQMNGENTSNETSANVRQGFDRERALAEAKIWGENWQEKTQAKASAEENFHVASAIG
ncbi:hypothetical protein BHM03_00027283 [Ensete ventricosum]|nr:hypothetical protein BHM03_00027283 [Ensete ventricosum]